MDFQEINVTKTITKYVTWTKVDLVLFRILFRGTCLHMYVVYELLFLNSYL